MNWYSQHVFPWLCDFAMNHPFVSRHRRELLSTVSGDILEIGIGTGLNLAHYPKHIQAISSVDPNPGMNRRLRQRSKQRGMNIDHRVLSSERLPFDRDRFDCIVSTWTMCSIANLSGALAEIIRVLKPGGRLLFLEHGLSPEVAVQKWQRRLNWLEGVLADGCRLDRDFRALLGQQPFRALRLDNFVVRQAPPTHGYMYCGEAQK